MPEIKIKDDPKLRSLFRNITEMTFTGFVWGIWLYLFLPVINIMMWIVGISIIEVKVFEQVGYMEFIELLSKMGVTVLIVFLVLRLWGYYNYIVFGRRSRRKESPPVTIEQLAKHYGVHAEEIRRMQGQKEVVWSRVS